LTNLQLRLLRTLTFSAFVVAAWWSFSSPEFESILALITTTIFLIGEFTLAPKTNTGEHTLKTAIQETGGAADILTPTKTLKHRVNSVSFFAEKFGKAFPGEREIVWFAPEEAVLRLERFFEPPFFLESESESQTPIWWFRDGNMGIDDFRVVDKVTVIIDFKELRIRRLAAIPSSLYYKQFIYLEVEPMPACGLYPFNQNSHDESLKYFGYDYEEFGVYKGKHYVTRKEFDDNAAKISGKLVTLGSEVEIRTRYITPYNMVIAPAMSPINNNEFDERLVAWMNQLLQDHSKLDELVREVNELPIHPYMRSEG
jgi:hypothetical protein